MESIRLKDGTTLEILEINDNNDMITILFSVFPLDELRTLFNKPNNLSVIEVSTEGGVICRVYEGFDKSKKKYIVDEETITVTITKQDETQQRLAAVEDAVNILILDALEV